MGLGRFVTILLVLTLTMSGCTSLVQVMPATREQSRISITVAAAADLQFAFTDLALLFEQATGHKVTVVFGSTGQLVQQIENGAPYDLLAAANMAFVDRLLAQNLALPETKALYARGRIVLGSNRASGITAKTLSDLLSPEIQRIAIANPDHAPYGHAARQALQAAGVWEALQPKLILGENIRQTLQFLQSGDAQVGIVALSIADVPEISWSLIDEELHDPLDQALVVIRSSPYPTVAQAFIEFVNSQTGRSVMLKYGFVLPNTDGTFPPVQ